MNNPLIIFAPRDICIKKSKEYELIISTEYMRAENCIGYAAYSASVLGTTTNDLSVSILSVDGIPASAETIKNKTYPLCRDYLLAYNGELSDLEADFLRYVKGAGQKIVQQSSP